MAVVVAWVLQGGGVAVAVAPGGGVEALVALHAASARTSTTVRVRSLVAASRRAMPESVIVSSMARSFCAKRPVPAACVMAGQAHCPPRTGEGTPADPR